VRSSRHIRTPSLTRLYVSKTTRSGSTDHTKHVGFANLSLPSRLNRSVPIGWWYQRLSSAGKYDRPIERGRSKHWLYIDARSERMVVFATLVCWRYSSTGDRASDDMSIGVERAVSIVRSG
jgi:hypothetical protein